MNLGEIIVELESGKQEHISVSIPEVYLFHHEPNYDDEKIQAIYQAASQYGELVSENRVKVHTAMEGLVVQI
jgi:hypothetical protein